MSLVVFRFSFNSQLSLQFYFTRGGWVVSDLNRRIPDQRLDPARSSVVFATVNECCLCLQLYQTHTGGAEWNSDRELQSLLRLARAFLLDDKQLRIVDSDKITLRSIRI